MRPETPYSSNFHSTVGQSSAEFARFLACGGTAALINIVSRYFLSRLVSFPSAVLIAYAIGMVVAYTLFRTLVFGRSGRSVVSESYRFAVVNAVAVCLVLGVSVLLASVIFPMIHFTWHAEDVAHVIGVGVPTITSYIGHKNYTFRT